MTLAEKTRALKLRAYFRWRKLGRFRYYEELLANERRTPQEIERLALDKLGGLLRRCAEDVPYYRDIFARIRFDPETVRSMQDLERLPLLTRELVRRRGVDLLSRTAPPVSYHPHSSGGSTGVPLDFYRSWEYEECSNTAGRWRSAHRAGWNPGEKMAWIWGQPPLNHPVPDGAGGSLRGRLGAWARDDGTLLMNAFNANAERMREWVAIFRRHRPRFIVGYASALENFARFLEEEKVEGLGIAGVISTAEPLFPDQRALLERVFGALVIDQYGAREICSIATGCARGGMHINTDLVHVEFVPDPEVPDLKRIVVTDLHNDLFPFLRYVIGDVGEPSREACPCGLPFPLMKMRIGRAFDHFVSPEGRVSHGAFFKILMDEVKGVARYQFRQVETRRIVLLVKPGTGFGDATWGYLKKVQGKIHEGFSPNVALDVQVVEEIPPTAMGKHLYTICELPLPRGDGGGEAARAASSN